MTPVDNNKIPVYLRRFRYEAVRDLKRSQTWMTLEELGLIFNLNKGTISRILDKKVAIKKNKTKLKWKE
jgi:hypothetical protein